MRNDSKNLEMKTSMQCRKVDEFTLKNAEVLRKYPKSIMKKVRNVFLLEIFMGL